jgi:hypothetical protein
MRDMHGPFLNYFVVFALILVLFFLVITSAVCFSLEYCSYNQNPSTITYT